MVNKNKSSQNISELTGWLDKIINKVFGLTFKLEDISAMVMDKLIMQNKGIDRSKLKFILTEDDSGEHGIRFCNLYTALVYMGFWDDKNESWKHGSLVIHQRPNQDSFIMTNGTRIELSGDGNLNVLPVKPIKFIQLNVVVNKNGAIMTPLKEGRV